MKIQEIVRLGYPIDDGSRLWVLGGRPRRSASDFQGPSSDSVESVVWNHSCMGIDSRLEPFQNPWGCARRDHRFFRRLISQIYGCGTCSLDVPRPYRRIERQVQRHSSLPMQSPRVICNFVRLQLHSMERSRLSQRQLITSVPDIILMTV